MKSKMVKSLSISLSLQPWLFGVTWAVPSGQHRRQTIPSIITGMENRIEKGLLTRALQAPYPITVQIQLVVIPTYG